ncbi:DUF4142 domain-containing protein [Catellatospora sichuanensis]|uniref:DUF4142 domain-containing protein n=1 Tax=Catellatospora sichuanensis TaxID=1969805 RepID=UPI001182E4A0|nr:DUF4142 domain-containing protein [Catellatospora sichuanensis]
MDIRLARTAAVTALAALAVAVVLTPPPAAHAESLEPGWTVTEFGPLGPADRDLLVRVRLAGLWEAPAGKQAQDRARSAKVKEVGHHISGEHIALDAEVLKVADRLGVPLPDRPNAEQQSWLDELNGLRGAAWDNVFTARLRVAHGKVFSVVAAVRAGTRNEVIREFAEQAVTIVMRHMSYLESTGLVDYTSLPAPPTPVAAAARRTGGPPAPLIWLILAAALAVGAVTAARIRHPR